MGGQHYAPSALPPGKDPVPIVQEAGWTPGSVWAGAGNLVPTEIRHTDRPARSESLYRLSYPGPDSTVDVVYLLQQDYLIILLQSAVDLLNSSSNSNQPNITTVQQANLK